MTEQHFAMTVPTDLPALPERGPASNEPAPVPVEVAPPSPACSSEGSECRHARAGRKGARRVHQLIEEGRLYEQEHGLKRGRQRLRQLIELGKLYEEEHGLQPTLPKKHGRRLSRLEREELVATFLQCLVHMVKPSFRAELTRLAETLQEAVSTHAA